MGILPDAALGSDEDALPHPADLLKNPGEDLFAGGRTVNVGVIEQGVAGLVRGDARHLARFNSFRRDLAVVPSAGDAHAAVAQAGRDEGGCADLLGAHKVTKYIAGRTLISNLLSGCTLCHDLMHYVA